MQWPWSRKQITEEILTYGICVCGHARNCHREGKGKCCVDMTNEAPVELRKERPHSSWICACQVYIPKKDDSHGDLEPVNPSVDELEKIYKLQ